MSDQKKNILNAPMNMGSTPEKCQIVGKSVEKKEAREKVTGRAQYIDDVNFTDGLFGVTVRSTIARGKIKKIHFLAGAPWEEITVATAADIPGENVVATILNDQPLLAQDRVNHPEEAILLLAHPNREVAEAARHLVRVEYEEEPAVFNIEDSLQTKTIIWGEDNILKSYNIVSGDPDSVWSKADQVIEGTYYSGAQEQLYIEPQGMIATANPQVGVTVWGSMQCPYYIHKGLTKIFNLADEKVRIIQAETGGGFGGKEEYPTILAAHAALLAWKAKKPVKMIYSRAEDLACTTKRHPSRTTHRTAIDAAGRLLAMDIDFVLDGGAYATLSSVVLSRGTLHAAGPYFCPNIRIRGRAVATNTPPNGAFRGFGVPQSVFALETHLDQVAKRVGLSPQEFRRRNFIRDGQTLPTGQVVKDGVDLEGLLKTALEKSDFVTKQKQFAVQNSGRRHKKGIGLACFMHGAGFTGSGEKYLASVAGVEITVDGQIQVLVANTEIGQGARTVLSQIVADTLGVPYEWVDTPLPDTAHVPNSGPTVASRTSMVVGRLVESAARGIRETLIQTGFLGATHSAHDLRAAAKEYIKKYGSLCCHSQYRQADEIVWDDKTYRGDAYGTYAWAVYVAEVTVDSLTHQCQVDDFWAIQEVGKVLHPDLAAGQIEGGVVQAIGFALYEDTQFQNGRMVNNQLTNYIIPTTKDVPKIQTFFEEVPYSRGPWGAKGIGELPLDGGAPAVVNAVSHALGGVALTQIPIRPEDLAKITGPPPAPTLRESKAVPTSATNPNRVKPSGPPQTAQALPGPVTKGPVEIQLQVNGSKHQIQVPPMKRLLDVLRENLRLTGTKEGCGEGECGACSIILDGRLVNSCLIPALQAHNKEIQTIEGAEKTSLGSSLQKQMVSCSGVQCGICTPGMVLAAQEWLEKNPNATSESDIRDALAGNLCRCTGYSKIVTAVKQAAP